MPDTTHPILIRHLAPKNFLSFSPENEGIDLQSLNLFIGPNGSGKSNLIEAINLMRSAPQIDKEKDFQGVTRKGGGVPEWIWKGEAKKPASVEIIFGRQNGQKPVLHRMAFSAVAQAFTLDDESVEESEPRYSNESGVYFFYRYQNGQPAVNTIKEGQRKLAKDSVEPDRSILAQRRDPEMYPELAWLAKNYEKVRIYREWSFGRSAVFREPQKADMRNDTLEEDFSNLGLFLNRLKTRFPVAKKAILAGLRDLYDGITDFDVFIEGGTVQVFFTEGDFVIPATRLSDGTLRYLCLLAILCDPDPPPLICIEEPELGLHPDILPKVADLLKSASERTQIIVTTHSDILVDAMTDCPEAVVVCEKHDGKTEMARLVASELTIWLDKYRLGQLWIEGQLGGKRW
jgi:predicted ATPase